MYMYINVRKFDFDKSILKILHTNVEFILLIKKTVNILSKRLRLVILAHATLKITNTNQYTK